MADKLNEAASRYCHSLDDDYSSAEIFVAAAAFEAGWKAHAASTDRLRAALLEWDCPNLDSGVHDCDCTICHGSGLHPTAMSALAEKGETTK